MPIFAGAAKAPNLFGMEQFSRSLQPTHQHAVQKDEEVQQIQQPQEHKEVHAVLIHVYIVLRQHRVARSKPTGYHNAAYDCDAQGNSSTKWKIADRGIEPFVGFSDHGQQSICCLLRGQWMNFRHVFFLVSLPF